MAIRLPIVGLLHRQRALGLAEAGRGAAFRLR